MRQSLVILLLFCAFGAFAQLGLNRVLQNANISSEIVDIQLNLCEGANVSSNRWIYVVEQRGVISVLDANNNLSYAGVLLDISHQVKYIPYVSGLSGFDFARNCSWLHKNNSSGNSSLNFFFIQYTNSSGFTVVSRWNLTSALQANATSEEIFFSLDTSQQIDSFSGPLRFSFFDGFLYFGLGDWSTDGSLAQNTNSYFGKILRIDVTAASFGKMYSIPSTNAFANSSVTAPNSTTAAPTMANSTMAPNATASPTLPPLTINTSIGIEPTVGLPEIFAYGFRRPYRIWHDSRGFAWVTDIGLVSHEINVIYRASPILNFGYPSFEGTSCKGVQQMVTPTMMPTANPNMTATTAPANATTATPSVMVNGTTMPPSNSSSNNSVPTMILNRNCNGGELYNLPTWYYSDIALSNVANPCGSGNVGGVYYAGSSIEKLTGKLILGDLAGKIFALNFSNPFNIGPTSWQELIDQTEPITCVAVDRAGEILIGTSNGQLLSFCLAEPCQISAFPVSGMPTNTPLPTVANATSQPGTPTAATRSAKKRRIIRW